MGRHAGKTSDDTRNALLTTALRLVLERGFDGVRVTEIAREAGLSTGAIYSQFSSKAELLLAAMSEQAPRIVARHLDAGDQGPVLDLFHQLGTEVPRRGATVGRLLLEMVVTGTREPTLSAVVSREFQTNEQVLADGIRLGQRSAEIDQGLDPVALARFLHTVALGSLVAGAVGLPDVGDDEWDAVLTHVLDAIRSPSAVVPT